MAVDGAEVVGSWPLSSGFVILLILLFLLSIFLTTLCSDCVRHSFELKDAEVETNPSALIRVVKLEDAFLARENPMLNEIRNDEEESSRPAVSDLKAEEENSTLFKPWRSHLGALQNQESSRPAVSDMKPEEVKSTGFKPWRSHLGALPNQDSFPPTNTSQDALNSAVPSRDSGLRVEQNQEAPSSLEDCRVYEEKGGGGVAITVEPGISLKEINPDSTTNPEPPSAQ